MSVTRQQVIDAAREWLDTPFLHQGRVKGRGVDCAGLIIKVAHELELSTFDATDYQRAPNMSIMGRTLNKHMDPVLFSDRRLADVFWMAFTKQPQHLVIITQLDPIYIIHADAYAPGGARVVEHRLDSEWQSHIRKTYRYQGVDS